MRNKKIQSGVCVHWAHLKPKFSPTTTTTIDCATCARVKVATLFNGRERGRGNVGRGGSNNRRNTL
jgi:hypothetical protein